MADAHVSGVASCAAPSAREAVLQEAWQAIDAHIARGPLPGNGTDKTAERNGMVLACNILVELGARGIADGVDVAFYQTFRTPQSNTE